MFNMDDLNSLQLNPSDFSMGDESFWQEYLSNEPNADPSGAGNNPPAQPTISESGSKGA